ncbi:hypothetical protein DBR32_02815 [Taibaiella sp. KBW10]|uniref:multinuclear nonheme iron-dependent oxidase n=1 Tax=Taibaiella sp. KBW10 TaxID=2153357 RepID=UPI000F5922BF|nr:DUF692 family multinuclear iron-containing protein [Taibaiella sp. KBW10]RQO32547.1 hypothetical protein DBR32_02815 [Taibaiella sp. KBW10]
MDTPKILPTVACNLDADILSASLPLLEEGRVAAIEWSFDTLFKRNHILPEWFQELLETYSQANRLIGHGVFFSLFSGRLLPEQKTWLQHLETVSKQYTFDHITEHFGFMTGADFHKGAPMSIPYSKSTVAIGRDRLSRIQQACQCPVGLENLAFSYSLEEVKKHGDFLNELIEPLNGFIILDLHNFYCQLHNFNIPFDTLIALYPLDRVREIHISGGSWQQSIVNEQKQIRRDTHDGAVPQMVFELLQKALPLCPNLKYVVMEQLGIGLQTEADRLQFYRDFLQMEYLVMQYNEGHVYQPHNTFMPSGSLDTTRVVEDEYLYAEQQILSFILEHAKDHEDALHQMQQTALRQSSWDIEHWQPEMIDAALRIAQKWK